MDELDYNISQINVLISSSSAVVDRVEVCTSACAGAFTREELDDRGVARLCLKHRPPFIIRVRRLEQLLTLLLLFLPSVSAYTPM